MACRVLQIHDLSAWSELSDWLDKRSSANPEIQEKVKKIIGEVKERGDNALIEYTREFDCPGFKPPLAVTRDDFDKALKSVSQQDMENISLAAANIRKFHEAQKEKSWFSTQPDGSILGQMVVPVDSAGLYVPGGKGGDTPLISSLLMNAIPCQVAGCRRVAITTPPRRDGSVNPHLLAAARILGLNEVYRLGSAWAIAALALGTETVPPTDVIAGPGNIYVATAKRLLQGRVGIDMIAGPSEVLILADASANPVWVAADMLSQAEHDSLASAICVTTDMEFSARLNAELDRQLIDLPRREIAAKSLADWGCIAITPDMPTAIAIANVIAPEHLELCVSDPWGLLPEIRHAGAVFMGAHSPEPVGDYFAGPNHVLPTLGTARFSSSLSVQTFCKKTNIIATSAAFLHKSARAIAALARLEGLEAHARSVEARVNEL